MSFYALTVGFSSIFSTQAFWTNECNNKSLRKETFVFIYIQYVFKNGGPGYLAIMEEGWGGGIYVLLTHV